MAIKNRGLQPSESLGAEMASITASGLENIIGGPCFLYSVFVAEDLGADTVEFRISNAVASGTKESLQFLLASANLAFGASVDERTRKWDFSPPLHFSAGVFVSSTGLADGTITFIYKD